MVDYEDKLDIRIKGFMDRKLNEFPELKHSAWDLPRAFGIRSAGLWTDIRSKLTARSVNKGPRRATPKTA